MKQVQKQICYSITAVAVMLGMAAAPVSAEHGRGVVDSNTDSTSIVPINGPKNESHTGQGGTGTSSSPGANPSGHTGIETENGSVTEDNSFQSGKLHSEAEQLLSQQRKDAKVHTEAERQSACVQHKADIVKHEAQFSTQAANHLSTFNSIFTKLQAFHDSKGVTVANYDALVADATAKQVATQSAVDALKSVDVNIDCTQPDPASTVVTIKTAVLNARAALQEYRISLKNLVAALKLANTTQANNQNAEGTQ